jgi:hypothetical protein
MEATPPNYALSVEVSKSIREVYPPCRWTDMPLGKLDTPQVAQGGFPLP